MWRPRSACRELRGASMRLRRRSSRTPAHHRARSIQAPDSLHSRADRLAHRDAGRIEAFEAEHVDAEVIRRHALPVKRIDAARAAEVMARRHRVEAIFGQRVL